MQNRLLTKAGADGTAVAHMMYDPWGAPLLETYTDGVFSMADDRNRTLLILGFLWANTDESHPTTIERIRDFLTRNGISVKDARTIRGDIADLMRFGIDVVEQRRQQYQYFIGTRHFEAPEVKLLVDAVQSSRFITAKKSKVLIEKLSAFVGPSQADILHRQLYVERRAKADNEGIYITVDRIQTAITQRRKIEFQYYEYLPTKEKHLKHEGMAYELSPYAMLWNNNSYYVAGHSARHGKAVKYRVDRIENLEILDEPQVPPSDGFDVSEFFSQEFSMLDGAPCKVTLLCEDALMNSIIDRFGEDVETSIVNDSHFMVKATVDLSDTFYGWVFSSAGRMRIIDPPEAVKGFRNILKSFEY